MSRRTAYLVLLMIILFGFQTHAQLNIEAGEINLTGELIFAKGSKNPRLVLNSKSRAMKTINLDEKSTAAFIKDYKSGTDVEICMDVKTAATNKNSYQAAILKIRPLAPDEFAGVYNGVFKGCPKGKRCRHFGTSIEKLYSEKNAQISELNTDYFSCL